MTVLKVLYSFNKRGFEARYWSNEISAASTGEYEFIPFNHDPYLDPERYLRAQLLDNLYYERAEGLLRLYSAFERTMAAHGAQAVIVDTCPPYHPDYLRTIPAYKVLRIADGPISAYDRDFAYVHAYDHVLYHSPAYSRDLTMLQKLRYCGAGNVDLWPLALFDAAFDPTKTEDSILAGPRDIDVIFIGALHRGKIPFLASVKKALGRQCRMHGLTSLKRNLEFNLRYGFPGWIRPATFADYVPLYQRSKVGFNLHNRGDFTVGSYRLFDLPGNGVMQISDGGPYLDTFFEPGVEIVPYRDLDDLLALIDHYLTHEADRREIALNGFRRVMRDHRLAHRMRQAGALIEAGMKRVGRAP